MDYSLCQHKDIFGETNKGIHSYKIFNIAIVDTVGTIVVAWGISKYYNIDFKQVLFILFLVGIIAHRLFCVRTTIDKLLFP